MKKIELTIVYFVRINMNLINFLSLNTYCAHIINKKEIFVGQSHSSFRSNMVEFFTMVRKKDKFVKQLERTCPL